MKQDFQHGGRQVRPVQAAVGRLNDSPAGARIVRLDSNPGTACPNEPTPGMWRKADSSALPRLQAGTAEREAPRQNGPTGQARDGAGSLEIRPRADDDRS
jgi:hypothetical protein